MRLLIFHPEAPVVIIPQASNLSRGPGGRGGAHAGVCEAGRDVVCKYKIGREKKTKKGIDNDGEKRNVACIDAGLASCLAGCGSLESRAELADSSPQNGTDLH